MRLGSDFWPWIGSAVFPVTSFRVSFRFRILPWRVPRSVGPEHALDVQRAALHTWILLAGRRDKQLAVSILRITLGRFLGIPKRQRSHASRGAVNRVTLKHPREL